MEQMDITSMNHIMRKRHEFERDGFIQLSKFIPTENFSKIIDRCERLFLGEFETGVYPDEWHFRHGISMPDKTKEIVNAWKSDRTIASLVMNEVLAKTLADLLKWPSIRIAQDDVILKPPRGSAVGLHQDSTYISQNFILPDSARNQKGPLSVTVWIPLEPVDEENGTLLYASGSHHWKEDELNRSNSFHTGDDFNPEKAFQHLCGSLRRPEIHAMNLSPGDISVHHEDMWHCSGPNKSHIRHRRVIAVHFLRGDVVFRNERPSYIYGRYKLRREVNLREEFFPTVWPRSEFVKWHLENAIPSQLSKL